VAKQPECNSLAQKAYGIKDKAATPQVDNAIPKELAKLKHGVTDKNVLNKSMQPKLLIAVQQVEANKQALSTADDEKDTSNETMESSVVELNATNKALIQLNASSALTSIFKIESSNSIFAVDMTGFLTYNYTRIGDAVTSTSSTVHCHFGACVLALGTSAKVGMTLINGWAAIARLQFHNNAVVWAHHRFLAHTHTGPAS